MRIENALEGSVGPTRRTAAEEQTVGVVVLTAGDSALQRIIAVLLGISFEHRVAVGEIWITPLRGHQGLMELGVFRFTRVHAAVLKKVAVQINVILGHASHPSEAMRINRMHQDHTHIGRQIRCLFAQPADDSSGSAKALDTVSPRVDKQQRRGLHITE